MNQHPENHPPPIVGDANLTVSNVPHYTADAAHALEAARLTIQAMQRQVAECEDHNTELLGVIESVRAWCQANARAARNRAAQTGDSDWLIRQRVVSEVWNLVKPVV